MQEEMNASLPASFLVYLVRHAEPDRSRKDIVYHTVPGPDLTELGRTQAAELGTFLHKASVMHMSSSPLQRTWQTASIANEICNAALEMNQDLAEHRMDENAETVQRRAFRAFQRAARMSAVNGPAALITHGSPVMLILTALGMPLDQAKKACIYDSGNILPMAGVWRVEQQDSEMKMELIFAPKGIRIIPI